MFVQINLIGWVEAYSFVPTEVSLIIVELF